MTSTVEYLAFAGMIDHALLQPTLTDSDLRAGIHLARCYQVASVCIFPSAVGLCAELLAGSRVVPSTTIGFPHGGQHAAVKRAEARQALADGARELDMVVNISQVLSGDWERVRADIQGVAEITHAAGQKLKVIFENAYLQAQQKIRLCEICGELNVDWVKTSTGFGPGGATLEDLRLMREHSPPAVQIKAAGGVKDLDFCMQARALGVTRIGTSRTAALLDQVRTQWDLPPVQLSIAAEESRTATESHPDY